MTSDTGAGIISVDAVSFRAVSFEAVSIGAVSLAISVDNAGASVMLSFAAAIIGSLVVALNVVLFSNVVLFMLALFKAVVLS
jgi:hypothetical protein